MIALFKANMPLFEINSLALLSRGRSTELFVFIYLSIHRFTVLALIIIPKLFLAKSETTLYLFLHPISN